jgi:ubiquinone/menaquinone biosynthesis C-methylase UbiE
MVPRGVDYVATDILADPVIGLGRGEFYERHVGPFERVQADGENLPFADGSFDLVYCVASLHHALDARKMLKEMARVTRRGGVVAALNEGTRAPGASEDNPQQESEKSYGINEHVHTMWAYVAAFLAAGVAITRLEQAEGYDVIKQRRRLRHVLRVPLVGRTAATLLTQNLSEYSGITIVGRRLA